MSWHSSFVPHPKDLATLFYSPLCWKLGMETLTGLAIAWPQRSFGYRLIETLLDSCSENKITEINRIQMGLSRYCLQKRPQVNSTG